MSDIQAITAELHKAFRLCNEEFFGGEIPTPVITIQSNGHRRHAMGWATREKVWQDTTGAVAMYELNVSAEFLAIDFMETMDTLMHEMIHLYCRHKRIKEVSRGSQYHNKHFKEQSIAHGFEYPSDKPDPKVGWSYSRLTASAKAIIEAFDIDRDVFRIARNTHGQLPTAGGSSGGEGSEGEGEGEGEGGGGGKKKSHSIKWVCPKCGNIARTTKRQKLICGEDMTMMTTDHVFEDEEVVPDDIDDDEGSA